MTFQEQLAAPFHADEVQWKPQMVKQNRALAIAYISARSVMDRLDSVCGVGQWQDSYTVLPDGSVVCRLSVLIPAPNGEPAWIAKEDVGSLSEQPDGGDRLKAAFSDAMKRAAVKFGIGRYLYRLPSQWLDYDSTKKVFTQRPQIPAWAIPATQAGEKAAPPTGPPSLPPKPKTFLEWLHAKEQGLIKAGKCFMGDYVKLVIADMTKAKLHNDYAKFTKEEKEIAANIAVRVEMEIMGA